MVKNIVLDGIIGVCVGDALGVPVEFKSRNTLKLSPVTGMIGYQTHNQPPGTWSDDSSLTLCLAESLCNGYRLEDIGRKFVEWYRRDYWTARGDVFDIGGTTAAAISRIEKGEWPPERCGGNTEHDNGNGSLMRILPIVYYLKDRSIKEKGRIIDEVSSLTHAHIRSIIACTIYVEIAINIINGMKKEAAIDKMRRDIKEYFRKGDEINNYRRILENDISKIDEAYIRTSGYVVDTLEAALWCLLKGNNFRETLLMAVNLGGDTDTIGAVTGGLAGIYYGIEEIPKEWVEVLARREEIFGLCERLKAACQIKDK